MSKKLPVRIVAVSDSSCNHSRQGPRIRTPVFMTLFALIGMFAVPSAPAQPVGGQVAGLARGDGPDVISGEYIVAFGNGIAGRGIGDKDTRASAVENAIDQSTAVEARIAAKGDGSRVINKYRTSLIGFSARLSDEMLLEISRIDGVLIEHNRIMRLPDAAGITAPVGRMPDTVSSRVAVPRVLTNEVPQGLDRTDRRLLPLDEKFTPALNGAGVHIYVIDTGIFAGHSTFGNRVFSEEAAGKGHNATGDGKGTGDCRDHGTAVASIIGGKELGIATEVLLHPVRVFPCEGLNSSTAVMLAGVDWVAKDHLTATANLPVVANVSFKAHKSDVSDLLDLAIANSIIAGITYVIAAGNDMADACGVSPAHVLTAITVGNIKPDNDRRMINSNFGKCVDIFAPGVNILVAGVRNPYDTAHRNDTSFAAPHVTGVAALFLGKNPEASPQDVWNAILKAANNKDVQPPTPDWCGIPNRGTGSPNIMLHWGSGSDDGTKDAPLPLNAPPPPTC